MDFWTPFCECGERLLHEHGASFYASVRDGKRTGLLAGPFSTHAEALNWVEPARQMADKINPRAWFYGYGTLAVYSRAAGRLNDLLGIRY